MKMKKLLKTTVDEEEVTVVVVSSVKVLSLKTI